MYALVHNGLLIPQNSMVRNMLSKLWFGSIKKKNPTNQPSKMMNSIESLITTGVLKMISVRELIIMGAGLCVMW